MNLLQELQKPGNYATLHERQSIQSVYTNVEHAVPMVSQSHMVTPFFLEDICVTHLTRAHQICIHLPESNHIFLANNQWNAHVKWHRQALRNVSKAAKPPIPWPWHLPRSAVWEFDIRRCAVWFLIYSSLKVLQLVVYMGHGFCYDDWGRWNGSRFVSVYQDVACIYHYSLDAGTGNSWAWIYIYIYIYLMYKIHIHTLYIIFTLWFIIDYVIYILF